MNFSDIQKLRNILATNSIDLTDLELCLRIRFLSSNIKNTSGGICIEKQENMGKHFGLTRKSINQRLSKLQKLGFLSKKSYGKFTGFRHTVRFEDRVFIPLNFNEKSAVQFGDRDKDLIHFVLDKMGYKHTVLEVHGVEQFLLSKLNELQIRCNADVTGSVTHGLQQVLREGYTVESYRVKYTLSYSESDQNFENQENQAITEQPEERKEKSSAKKERQDPAEIIIEMVRKNYNTSQFQALQMQRYLPTDQKELKEQVEFISNHIIRSYCKNYSMQHGEIPNENEIEKFARSYTWGLWMSTARNTSVYAKKFNSNRFKNGTKNQGRRGYANSSEDLERWYEENYTQTA